MFYKRLCDVHEDEIKSLAEEKVFLNEEFARLFVKSDRKDEALARVNRPYEAKTCGMVIDYIGIFENLQRALAFDLKDISRGCLISRS